MVSAKLERHRQGWRRVDLRSLVALANKARLVHKQQSLMMKDRGLIQNGEFDDLLHHRIDVSLRCTMVEDGGAYGNTAMYYCGRGCRVTLFVEGDDYLIV